MKIFDKLMMKISSKTNGETLENLLKKSSQEPAFRAEFYKRLLTDELIVLTKNSDIPEGKQTLSQNTQISLITFSDGKIPIFTSTERIFDKGIIKEQVDYLAMKGENLFSTTKGTTFVLNPYSDYGKELIPEEIERLLNGTILTNNTETKRIEKKTTIQIGQPSIYPTDLVNSLIKLFSERLQVKSAYIGWINNPASNEPAHYIFGIEADYDYQNIFEEAGFTAKQYLSKDEFVDFIKIENKGGLSDYFLKQTPFYQRQK